MPYVIVLGEPYKITTKGGKRTYQKNGKTLTVRKNQKVVSRKPAKSPAKRSPKKKAKTKGRLAPKSLMRDEVPKNAKWRLTVRGSRNFMNYFIDELPTYFYDVQEVGDRDSGRVIVYVGERKERSGDRSDSDLLGQMWTHYEGDEDEYEVDPNYPDDWVSKFGVFEEKRLTKKIVKDRIASYKTEISKLKGKMKSYESVIAKLQTNPPEFGEESLYFF